MWEGHGAQHTVVFRGGAGGSEACYPAGEIQPLQGTHLHREMSVRLGLASVAGEGVVGAAGAHGACHVCFYATFEGVGAWCQAAALEQSTDARLLEGCRSRPLTSGGLRAPVCSGSLLPGLCRQAARLGQGRGLPHGPRVAACWSSGT